jgi:ethanolamine utilization protein EutP (predicted NTPase)
MEIDLSEAKMILIVIYAASRQSSLSPKILKVMVFDVFIGMMTADVVNPNSQSETHLGRVR